MLEEADHLRRTDRPRMQLHVEVPPGQPRNRRKHLPVEVVLQHRGLPLRGPGAAPVGSLAQPALVYEDDRLPEARGVFSNLANAGIYVLEPEVIDFIPTDIDFDFGHDLFPMILECGHVLFGHEVDDPIIDIGTPEQYRLAQELWRHNADFLGIGATAE